jgi:hypothetical protein
MGFGWLNERESAQRAAGGRDAWRLGQPHRLVEHHRYTDDVPLGEPARRVQPLLR